MTVKVILSYCQIILTFVTTIENWIEILKIKKGFAPPIMGSILIERNNTYNVRNFQKNLRYNEKELLETILETISYRSLETIRNWFRNY